MIIKVWELVCDQMECNSLLHFDETLDINTARLIAHNRFGWGWSFADGDSCSMHRETAKMSDPPASVHP